MISDTPKYTRETRGYITTGRERRPAPDVPVHMFAWRGDISVVAGGMCAHAVGCPVRGPRGRRGAGRASDGCSPRRIAPGH